MWVQKKALYCNIHRKTLKKKTQCIPVNIAKFLRTAILKNICEPLFPWVGTAN